ncbi:hypothetical protein ACLOJK_012411 [Asimina triloba]
MNIEIFVTQESEPVLEDGKLYKSQSCCDPPMTSGSGSMPKFQTIFDSIGDKWGKCVVGVFVCGPLSLQTSVAAECRSNGTIFE